MLQIEDEVDALLERRRFFDQGPFVPDEMTWTWIPGQAERAQGFCPRDEWIGETHLMAHGSYFRGATNDRGAIWTKPPSIASGDYHTTFDRKDSCPSMQAWEK
jgi:hypothetical protein